MMTADSRPVVTPGQVWTTKDSRDAGRQIVVDRVAGRFAYCTTITPAPGRPSGVGRQSRILVRASGASTSLPGWRLTAESRDELGEATP